MAKSLLAHLYTHIRGSQEDIATLALQYILMQSKRLNRVFTKRISEALSVDLESDLQYSTQVTGKDKERPDMAGAGSDGKELILCEMKFYAGLTNNQPLTYLERLEKNAGKGLVFICPESRIITLWAKLLDECEKNNKSIAVINDYCVKVDNVNMAIVTWAEILELLEKNADAFAVEYSADIKQLKGYCEEIDSEAFIPFKQEELTAENAKKAERFYWIVDKVTDLLLSDKSLNSTKKGLKATANRDGYISYLFVRDYGLAICYDRAFWMRNSSIETPFWLGIKNKKWKQTDEILNQLNKYPKEMKEEWGYVFLGLEVMTNVTDDEVCIHIKNQILSYLDDIDNSKKSFMEDK